MNATEYKNFHESFMQNNNGTTYSDVMSVIAPISMTTFLTIIIYISLDIPTKSMYKLFMEFILIVQPIILSVTILSNSLNTFIWTLIFIILPIIIKLIFDIYNKKEVIDIFSVEIPTGKREFITILRAIINLITAVCILAVDFQIFPRRFAKTENYGFGLMDTGVGLYVFGNAIIAPEIYKTKFTNFMDNLKTQIVNIIPLLILGISRFVIVNEIDYQQHISEYGVHWNFFITLAFTKLLGTMLLHIIPENNLLIIAFLFSVLQELILYCGLSQWVLSDIPRDTFLTANREGITSILGYICLYLFSVHIGKVMNVKTKDMKSNISSAVRLGCYSMLLNALTYIYHHHFGVSRRLANFGYATFVLSLAVTMSLIFLIMELFFAVYSKFCKNLDSTNYAPLIFKSINYNGLLFFLIANLGTGFVNLSIRTMLVQPFYSICIVTLYMLVICSIVTVLLLKEIKLKIW